MKLEMELKPGDIVLLKLLACVLILFFMARFLIFPGIEKHQDLAQKKDDVTIEQQEMQQTIDSASMMQAKIEKQQAQLKDSTKGYYQLMENQQIDELISGLILKHDLFPVYLNISEAVPGIPSAYQVQDTNADTSTTTSAEDELDGDSNSDSDTLDSSVFDETTMIQYINTTTVSVTLQGSEGQIRAFLDDIAKNYPGIQVRSLDMQEQTYVDNQLQTVGQVNCSCELAVYTCGVINNSQAGEESTN